MPNYGTVKIGGSMKIIKNGIEVERNPLFYFTIKKEPFLVYQDIELGEVYLASVINEDGKLKLIKPKSEFQDSVRKIIQIFVQNDLDVSALSNYDFWMVLLKEIELQTLEEVDMQKIMLSRMKIENILKNQGVLIAQRDTKEPETKAEKNNHTIIAWLLFLLIACAFVVVFCMTFLPKEKESEIKSILQGESTVTLMEGDTFVDPFVSVLENGVDVTTKATISKTITKDGINVPEIDTEEEGTYVITYVIEYKKQEEILIRDVIVQKNEVTSNITCVVRYGNYSGFFQEETESEDTLVYVLIDGKLQETYTDTTVGRVDFTDSEKNYEIKEESFRTNYCSDATVCDFTWNGDELTVFRVQTLEEDVVGLTQEEFIAKMEEDLGEKGICH